MLSSADWQKGWGTAKPGRSPRKGRRLSTFLGASRVSNELCPCSLKHKMSLTDTLCFKLPKERERGQGLEALLPSVPTPWS